MLPDAGGATGTAHGSEARAVLILVKAPAPGTVKTRLCPPCTPHQAAALAAASLTDTLAAVRATPGTSTTVVLEGEPGPWLPAGTRVIRQRGSGLDERLEASFEDAGTPALLIGGDTPQVTPELLGLAMATLHRTGVDAVLGPAPDGGYWALGLRRFVPNAVTGVPMSHPATFEAQWHRLQGLGLSVAELPPLRDVDTIEDARAVASAIPHSRFAATLASVTAALGECQGLGA
jgi:rSAM/selenodomain-associated transferase 1